MTYPASANGEQLLAFKNAGQVPLLLATDEEGGNVQRFKRVGALPIPSSVPGTMTPDQIEQAVAAHAKVIKALGRQLGEQTAAHRILTGAFQALNARWK